MCKTSNCFAYGQVCSIKVGNCAVVLARKYVRHRTRNIFGSQSWICLEAAWLKAAFSDFGFQVIIFLGLLATIVAVYCLRWEPLDVAPKPFFICPKFFRFLRTCQRGVSGGQKREKLCRKFPGSGWQVSKGVPSKLSWEESRREEPDLSICSFSCVF